FYHYQQDISRRNGYLEFYHKTRNLRRAPLFVISAGNAILVALIKLLEDYCNDETCTPLKLKPWYFLQILSTIEVILTMIALIWYLGMLLKQQTTLFLNRKNCHVYTCLASQQIKI
ncbi:unnamed protein product, partial [Didymodactylos carnosus]